MIVEQKRQEAKQKAQALVRRRETRPGGKHKADKTKQQISVRRHFISFREYPQYAMMKHFRVYNRRC